MVNPAPAPIQEAAPAGPTWPPFAVAWTAFWLLMIGVAVQNEAAHGSVPLWMPLLWEGSSCLVATVLVWAGWRHAGRLDAHLPRPAAWFLRALAPLPLVAPAFVVGVFAIRHTVHAQLGVPYTHLAWGPLLVQESLKFSIFYGLFAAVLFGLRSSARLAGEQLRAQRAAALQQQAQLLQLAQQIEPHFLFNALNTIAATVHDDPARAEALVTRLGSLLRAATDLARRPQATLAEELALLEAYADIMLERFGPRVSLQWAVDDNVRACALPTLSLQPLLENCFRHGVERHPGAVALKVEARREGPHLAVTVTNDVGSLDSTRESIREGVGLSNLRQRLQVAYGAAARLELQAQPGGGLAARLEVPVSLPPPGLKAA